MAAMSGTHDDEWSGAAARGLRAELDRLSDLALESLPNGVLVLGADGTIMFANRQLEEQFGYAAGRLTGQPVEILLPEALREAHVAHRHAFMTRPEPRTIAEGLDLMGLRADGSTFPVQVGLSPTHTGNGTWVVATVVDISARKQAEIEASRALEAQLAFERLVAELSVQFINLPASSVNDAIQDALRRIGETLDIDRCQFFQVEPDGMLTRNTGWVRDGQPEATPVPARERFPWTLETALAGHIVCFSHRDEIPNPVDRASYEAQGTQAALVVPLSIGGRVEGAVGFSMFRRPRAWRPDEVHRLRVIATAFGNALARRKSDEQLHAALGEVERLRDRIHAENAYLRREVKERLGHGKITGQSAAIRRVLAEVEQVAATDATVLLLGETGTGKELVAAHVHELSARRGREMVRVNCSAIPATLIESELFGREKGAFTGALARQFGRFELADHSTIFLDEIGDLPADVQVKLLRVLEERQIERLGSPRPIRVDTRIIAATHRNLERAIAEGTFREDLFYRLNVFPIQVPPLRERVDDIPLLVWRFVDEFSKSFGKRIDAISRETMSALQEYAWPGNIRELRNVVERAVIVATGQRLSISLPRGPVSGAPHSTRLADIEKDHIRRVLESAGWRIRGSGGAAERLGMRPTTLETRMAKLGLGRPKAARSS
jgi:PAS domain S-box-containing protein